jgi:hypothetical protein
MTQRLTLKLAFPLSELRKGRQADLALLAFGDSLDDTLKSPKRHQDSRHAQKSGKTFSRLQSQPAVR